MNNLQQDRLDALGMMLAFGPEYDRNVATAVSDALLFDKRGETQSAEHYLLMAEMRAGIISWDEFQSRDPFNKQEIPMCNGCGIRRTESCGTRFCPLTTDK